MKRTRENAWISACAVALLLSACGGKKEAPKLAVGGASTTPAAAAAATSAPSTVDPHVDAFRLGYAFGPDGQVLGEGNVFAKGEKVFVSFGIRDTKPGSSTRLVWVRNPAGTKLGEETKALPADPGTVSFVGDAATWSTGEYALEIWVLEPSAEPRHLATTRFTVSATRSK